MPSAQGVEQAFFPLDEELGLLPGALTPSLQQDVVRLGAWMPFARAVGELAHFRRTDIAKSSVRRLTERAGAAYVCVQNEAVERIERELPEPPPGPRQQFVSVDGAMVPLVGGEWAEVKTLVIGEVLSPQVVKGEEVIHTAEHSYFSRLTDATTFARLALVETQRRGVETAQAVAAVTDGAEWIQSFIDHHRPDAVRILDFAHASEYLNAIAQALWGEQSQQKDDWLSAHLHQLKHEGAGALLAALRTQIGQAVQREELSSPLAYLEKRTEMMDYPRFHQAGWPIGDGAVESANKLVVEARLKGSGMHWARPHVDAMLALRTIACTAHWEEAWPQITATLRQQPRQQTAQRRHSCNLAAAAEATSGSPLSPPTPPLRCADQPLPSPPLPSTPHLAPSQPSPTQPWRPPANHPWRHMSIGRARCRPKASHLDA